MPIHLRAWLASFALSCIPAFAWGQQYVRATPTAPIALEARLSLSDGSWDPAALVAALTPRGLAATSGVDAIDAETEAADEPPSLRLEPPAATEGAPAIGPAEPALVAAAKTDATEAVPCHGGLTPEPSPAFHELIGVDHCVPESLRRRIAIARKLRQSPSAPAELAEHPSVPAEAGRDPAAAGSDSPVIVTLVEQEEYLSYDLTAIDRVKRQLFPFGLPRYVPEVRLPRQPTAPLRPLFEVASAPPEVDVPAAVDGPAEAERLAAAKGLAEADATAEPDGPAESEALAAADSPAAADGPVEADSPMEAGAPAETEGPAESEALAEADSPAAADGPAEAERLAETPEAPAKQAVAGDSPTAETAVDAEEAEAVAVVEPRPAETESTEVAASETEPLAAASTEVAQAEALPANSPANSPVARQPHPLPLDCLIDEAVWQVRQLEAKHHLSQRLDPQQIGRDLARLMGATSPAGKPLEDALAALHALPTVEPAVEPAAKPAAKPAARIAAAPSATAPVAAPLDSELAGAPAVCCPLAEMPEEAAETVESESESESAEAAVAKIDLEAVESALAHDEDSALETLIDELAEEATATPATATADDAGEPRASTLAAAAEPAAGDPAVEQAMTEWNKVLGIVRAFSDQWNERVASQPEENAVR